MEQALLDRLDAVGPDRQAALARILGDRRSQAAIPALLEQTAAEETEPRVAAWEALRTLGRPEHIEKMVARFTAVDDEAVRKPARAALTTVAARAENPSRHAPAVRSALDGAKTTWHRRTLYAALAQLPCKTSYEAVESATRADDAAIRDAAVRRVAKWPTPRALPRLLDLVENAEKPSHRTLALRGAVRLLKKSGSDPAEAAGRVRRLMDAAETAEDKKLVLSAASEVAHPRSLRLATGHLENEALRVEASLAVVTLGEKLGKDHADLVRRSLEKVVELTSREKLRKRAERTLKKLK